MSVWSTPCYSVEPLRYVANNLPIAFANEFPDFLDGIANFHYGNCNNRHPEKAGKLASEFFKENPKEWKKFYDGGRRSTIGTESIKFANTLIQTNVKHAGIRAVYWAFKKFRTKEWKTTTALNSKEAVSFTNKAFILGAAAARIQVRSAQAHAAWYEEDAFNETGWATREEIADSVNYLWTIRSAKKVRKLNTKSSAIISNIFSSKTKTIKHSEAQVALMNRIPSGLKPVSRFDVEDHKKQFGKVMKKIKRNEEVSTQDAMNVSILPYVSYPFAKSRLVVFVFKNGLVLYDTVDKEAAIFLQKDYDRLVQMLQADAKLSMYFQKYSVIERDISRKMFSKYEEIMISFLDNLDVSSDDICNKYCRGYDVLQFTFLATLATDLNDDAYVYQMEKIEKEGIRDFIDVDKFLEVVDDEEIGVKESLELIKFHKIFPCPDYCIYSVVDSIEDKSKETYPVVDEVIIGQAKGVDVKLEIEEFKMYVKRNKIIMFYDAHKFLPGKLYDETDPTLPKVLVGYPNVNIENIRVEHVAYIDIRGSFNYRKYDGCEEELVKDKVIAPLTHKTDKRLASSFAKIEKNQVLKFLFSETFMKQKEVRELASSGELFETYRSWILLSLKAEAKKPGSRVFMMGTDEQRRFLSEFESNVDRYTRVQRGSSVGKSSIDLAKRLGELAATPLPISGLMAILISFDLAGFSTNQNPRFKRVAVESWEEVFDEDFIGGVFHVFTKTQLVFQKYDVDDEFQMVGNDLEGYSAKLNTSAHLDVMGYAVYKLKEMELTSGAAGLEVFVDDGLLRVNAVLRDRDGRRTMDVISKVYEFVGQKVSLDKTFCSRLLCQYLNRVFYDGVEVTPGAKAFMRIGKKQEVAIPTITEELMAHGSTARGAIQNGTEHPLAHYAYLFECYKTMKRWGLKETTDAELDKLAFASYIPVGLGGFGLDTVFNLSTNESFNAVQSGIAAMKMICHTFPHYAEMANTYLNSGIRSMDDESVLRNPTSFRTKLRCLNVRRFANAAKAKVLRTSTNILISEANRGAFDAIDDAAVLTIAKSKKVSEVKRQLLWDMTFSSYLEKIIGKLQSSNTAASLLGARKCLAIYIANRSEARMLLNETATGNLRFRDMS